MPPRVVAFIVGLLFGVATCAFVAAFYEHFAGKF